METYRTFVKRITPHLPPDDVAWSILGYIVSKWAHRHDKRKKEKGPDGKSVRYFEHPRRAATRVLLDIVQCYERETLISTFIHDVPEDNPIITPFMIGVWFGPLVKEVVVLVTKRHDTDEQYYEELRASKNWRALLVKMCDRYDNLQTLGDDIAFQKKQVAETRNKIFPLIDLLFKLVPEEGLDGVKALYKKMIETIERYERNWP